MEDPYIYILNVAFDLFRIQDPQVQNLSKWKVFDSINRFAD